MEDTLKNLLYAGVGLASEVTEKFKSEIDKLVEKGKMTEGDGKKLVDDLFSKTNEAKSNFEGKFNEFIEKLGYSKADDLEALKNRIEELESKVK